MTRRQFLTIGLFGGFLSLFKVNKSPKYNFIYKTDCDIIKLSKISGLSIKESTAAITAAINCFNSESLFSTKFLETI